MSSNRTLTTNFRMFMSQYKILLKEQPTTISNGDNQTMNFIQEKYQGSRQARWFCNLAGPSPSPPFCHLLDCQPITDSVRFLLVGILVYLK